MIQRSNARERARTEQMTPVASGDLGPVRRSVLRDGAFLKVPVATRSRQPGLTGNDGPAGPGTGTLPARRDGRGDAQPTKPRVLPISLLSMATSADGPSLSKTYAPYGRLIPCETVVTIESSRLDTPVIGLVTEDVWHPDLMHEAHVVYRREAGSSWNLKGTDGERCCDRGQKE